MSSRTYTPAIGRPIKRVQYGDLPCPRRALGLHRLILADDHPVFSCIRPARTVLDQRFTGHLGVRALLHHVQQVLEEEQANCTPTLQKRINCHDSEKDSREDSCSNIISGLPGWSAAKISLWRPSARRGHGRRCDRAVAVQVAECPGRAREIYFWPAYHGLWCTYHTF